MGAELNKLFFIMSFSFAVWTSIHLWIASNLVRSVKVPVVGFMVLLSIPLLNAYLAMSNTHPIPLLGVMSQNLTLAYGPLLWLLVQQLVFKVQNNPMQWIHFLPWFIVNCFALLGVYWISPWWFLVLLLLHVSGYCMRVGWLIRKDIGQLQRLFTSYKASSYFWFALIALCMMLTMWWDIAIWSYISYFNIAPDVQIVNYAASGFCIFVSSLALLGMLQPNWALESGETGQVNKESLTQNAIDEHTIPKIRQVELTHDVAQTLGEELHRLMREYQLYQESDLSLDKLAALLGISRNQLSELLNVHLQVTFYEYLNNFRFEASLQLLKESQSNRSILDIAYQAGFNNKNSFYTTFKRKLGMTPSEYRKKQTI